MIKIETMLDAVNKQRLIFIEASSENEKDDLDAILESLMSDRQKRSGYVDSARLVIRIKNNDQSE